MKKPLQEDLREVAPLLASQVDLLCEEWLASLFARLNGGTEQFRPKQLNDPIWGTIELLPREVALLDSRLLQRMRGVRQLGLAQLVFPGASHDRLEHIMGVVGAVERMTDALSRQITRWNNERKRHGETTGMIPLIDDEDRQILRLAAMFHDLGHGPFSHAIEPVLDVASPIGAATDEGASKWRQELGKIRKRLTSIYSLNGSPATSEIIAVMIVVSTPVTRLLKHTIFCLGQLSDREVQERIVAAIIGGVEGPGATHLSTLISGQVDADRLDFLARDAHHSGLEIGFDTDRLLSKLEVLQVRDSNLDVADDAIHARIANAKDSVFHQIGIAASGYGSLEQMLIGRTFLYDRLYHHHKVRAAEAMAQRMLLVAERDRGRRVDLAELFLSIGDDTFLRILAGEVTHPKLSISSSVVSGLARGILDRDLLHRAFAFRGRFIATPPGLTQEKADANRDAQWKEIVKQLDGLQPRFELGVQIHTMAMDIATALRDADVDTGNMEQVLEGLKASGPDQIIVDLPGRKAGAIRILARYPDGALKLPEFSFNPQKWADAYDLQKRTGYVFCRKDIIPVVSLASRVTFLREFGAVMSKDADGYIKAGQIIEPHWMEALVACNLIDAETAGLLTGKRHSLLRVRAENLSVPDSWLTEDPDFASKLALDLNKYLKGGLTLAGQKALTKTTKSLWQFVDSWYLGDSIVSELASERDLQKSLRDHLRSTLNVEEGSQLSGGELDLLVEQQVVIENKFHSRATNASTVAKAAGMQGRRYGLALSLQLIVVVSARRVPAASVVPRKTQAVTVRAITDSDLNCVELRIDLPFGAPLPSRETPEV